MSDVVAGRPNRGAWALVHFLALGQQGQEAAATDMLSSPGRFRSGPFVFSDECGGSVQCSTPYLGPIRVQLSKILSPWAFPFLFSLLTPSISELKASNRQQWPAPPPRRRGPPGTTPAFSSVASSPARPARCSRPPHPTPSSSKASQNPKP
jgi:hypothetical protein